MKKKKLENHGFNNLAKWQSPRRNSIVSHHMVNDLLSGLCLCLLRRVVKDTPKASVDHVQMLCRQARQHLLQARLVVAELTVWQFGLNAEHVT